MTKKTFHSSRSNGNQKPGIFARWMKWLEEPFEQLSALRVMIPQAKLSARLMLVERREMAALRSPSRA